MGKRDLTVVMCACVGYSPHTVEYDLLMCGLMLGCVIVCWCAVSVSVVFGFRHSVRGIWWGTRFVDVMNVWVVTGC